MEQLSRKWSLSLPTPALDVSYPCHTLHSERSSCLRSMGVHSSVAPDGRNGYKKIHEGKSFLVFLAEWIGEARERWKSTTWIRGFKLGDKENHDTTSKNRKNKNWFWEKSIAFTWDRILKLMTEYSNRNVSRKLLIK